MKVSSNGRKAGIKHFAAILPVVAIFIIASFLLIRSQILTLSTERLSLTSKSYSYEVSTWASKVLGELGIFKEMADREEALNEHSFNIISASYGSHDAYPYGIYWGDEFGNYYDSSGWEPDEDYVPAERDWYIEGLEHTEFAFGEPYLDEMTGDTCVSATVRMDKGGVQSVMSADIYLDYASRIAKQIATDDIERAFFVTGKNRLIIASSDEDETAVCIASDSGSRLHRSINELLDRGFTGQALIRADKSYYVDINMIDNTDWFLVTCADRFAVIRKLINAEVIMLLIGAIACTALILLTLRASREMSETYQRAKTDPLTRLYNRDSFRKLTLMTIKEEPMQGVMIIFDMDNFKLVNDNLGHPEGDAVLKGFAELLNRYFNRGKDIAARIGGDEFAVFAGRKMSRDDASIMLGKFIELFHKEFDGKYEAQALSVSIGAAFTEDSPDYGDLYHRADTALYMAKQKGKNGFFIAASEKQSAVSEDETEDGETE